MGASLLRAADQLGLTAHLCDTRAATRGPRIASTLSWRLFGHRPLHLNAFSRSVVASCRQYQPKTLVTTGQAPVNAGALREIGAMGIALVNYSTDDPWNPGFYAKWFSDALLEYDRVYTTRRANIGDFLRHGCTAVEYLPFGYDDSLWLKHQVRPAPDTHADIFFAGAAEEYRVDCIRHLIAAGVRVALAGDYWQRFPDLRSSCVGHLDPAQLAAWTAAVPLALCLVRRANRDGHVMRTFEIPALGACMVVEDTEEHREVFGPDGVAVRYFRTPGEVTAVAKELLASPETRQRLAHVAQSVILGLGNTYADRLRSLLQLNTAPRRESLSI